MEGLRFNEEYLSQVPALQLLINLGFEYLPSGAALKARGWRLGNLLLEDLLRQQLKAINRIQIQGPGVPVQRGEYCDREAGRSPPHALTKPNGALHIANHNSAHFIRTA